MVQHHAAALEATTKMAGIIRVPAGMIHQ
jgi:hypothetical protein